MIKQTLRRQLRTKIISDTQLDIHRQFRLGYLYYQWQPVQLPFQGDIIEQIADELRW